MELVYLWIEDYKNIKKQGFNFSPKFHCDYNEEKNELTIEENNDYIPDFFGENIKITAIVGKNGSGKSSLFESFDFSWKEVYYIYYKERQLYSNHFDKEINGRDIKIESIHVGIDVVYMNKFFFMQKQENSIFASLYKENLYAKKFKDFNNNELNPKKFYKNMLELLFKQTCLYPSFFTPKDIFINLNLVNQKLKFIFPDLIDFLKTYDYKYYYKVYLKSFEIIQPYKNNEQLKDYKNQLLKELKSFIKQKDKILEYVYKIDEELYSSYSDIEIFNFLEKIFPIENKKIKINDFYTKYLKEKNESYFDIFYYLYRIGFLEYEIYDEKNKRFSSLSSGEKSVFSDFCLLNEKLKEEKEIAEYYKESTNRIIFLDEPDLTLHPEWQKQYISTLILFLKKYENMKFHIIVTTHSPFLLSDLPQQNIIFLKDGKQVNGLKEKKQTFGANIHTLLSDSFFMEDGLMGEFAKSKIDEVIRLLNQDNLSKEDIKYCEQIISIIGEPIIKNQLQRFLDSKRLKKIDEIEALKESIVAMQKRLDELEK